MAHRLVAKFHKPGAEFNSAQQDRKQFFTDDLKNQLDLVYQDLKDSGLIVSGPELSWDQSTQILTIERVVRDQIEEASTLAGWSRISFDVVPVSI